MHLPGIGPERQAVLHRRGLRTWHQIAETVEDVPRMGAHAWAVVRAAARQSLEALERDDLHTLVCELRNEDHWRLLGSYMEQATFFDIETTGLSVDSQVTVVVCRHRDRLHTFVRGRNLEEFLELLDDVELLASFNGSSFDVPRVARLFNIPAIPCPHIDLRWLCYHQGLTGGLKRIERELGVRRPADLQGVEGSMAEVLWRRWELGGDRKSLERLIRYCCADVQALTVVAAELIGRCGIPVPVPEPKALWCGLDEIAPPINAAEQGTAESPVLPEAPLGPENAPSAPSPGLCDAGRREARKRRLQNQLRQARQNP